MAIKVSGTEVISDDKRILNNESLPDIRPSLLLDFANSKALDPRITFTRGSTATYWDGKTTTKAEENLYKYSQDFGNTWSSNAVGILTNNTTAPDGTSTAEKIYSDTGSSYHYTTQNNDVPAGVYTSSVYIKAAGYNYAGIRFTADSFSGTRYAVVIDLTNGTFVDDYTVGSPSYTPSYAITSVGNDWYRLSITVEQTQSSGYMNTSIFITDDSTPTWQSTGLPTFTGDGSSGIFLWGAQLEQRSSATAYTPTTSTPVVKYQPTLQTAASGEARFDHDPVTGESKGLLIEESRTNLENNSTGGVSYVGAGSSLTTNYAIAPDGTNTASYLKAATATGTKVFDHYGQTASTTPHTYSVFIKAYGYNRVGLEYLASGGFAENARFNLSDGTVYQSSSGATGHIQEIGNGWYRIAVTCTPTSTASDIQRIFIIDDNGNSSFAGDGFSGLLAWGYQNETGSFPTSYIPTSGSTVTRAVDSALMIGSNFTDWFSNEESTVFVDFERRNANQSGTYPMIASLSDGTTDNVLSVYLNNGETFFYETRAFNSTNAILSTTVTTQGSSYKVAGTLKTNDMAASFDGATVTTDTDALNPPNINRLDLGSRVSYLPYTGTIKKFAYYPKRLSDATLQAMTEE